MRAIVVLMSAQGRPASALKTLMQVSDDYVRQVVHAFNERGFDALDPKWSGGRPKRISEWVRQRICLIARTTPAEWGITTFSTWSLAKLAAHLERARLVSSISR
ncbi:helix-turn-helix domain-containing protein [Spongiactinospora rosea]|uniref:helix-turn-helix domain-containing protein n=1 Tax=Spongiactinospora rosea TaxID=2248750 RepID=UPI0018F3860C|nr:helix-turn-helix domain containing protein [Spongiactinospora rosea]